MEETYNDLGDNTWLSQGTEQEGQRASDPNDEANLKNDKRKSEL